MSAQQKLHQFIHGQPSIGLPFEKELVVDLFAGGGGASTGIARAYREPDVAVNHNPIALAVHRANHPTTAHYVADVFEVDPREATGGQPVAIIWASPDCRHHSKAKGGAPRDRGVRGLAWVVIRWLFVTKSRLLFLENVEEFCDWGPIDDDGQPIKSERGRTFKAFIAAISTGLPADHPDMLEIIEAIGEFVPMEALVRGLGYNAEWRERIAANAGTPTIASGFIWWRAATASQSFGRRRSVISGQRRSNCHGDPRPNASTGATSAARSSAKDRWPRTPCDAWPKGAGAMY